jgi:uncharacterized Rmd1/YagE family protein
MSETAATVNVPRKIRARAWFLGHRLDVRPFDSDKALARAPLMIPVGRAGSAVLFRYGAVVLFDLDPAEEKAFLESLNPSLRARFDHPESEETTILITPDREERIDPDGALVLASPSYERLQVVAHTLAKSTVLAYYEQRVSQVFDRIESMAEDLRRGVRSPGQGRELLRQLGDVLLTQTRTVGRVEVTEKPEITWDHPDLDRLYERLGLEYELRDRDLALSRKLELISDTAGTYLDLLQNRQTIRVEWYIVVLILVEIVISLYEIFLR